MEALLIAASSYAAIVTAALIGLLGRALLQRNNKKHNPGVEVLLARMDEKLNRLESIEGKLDDLLRR